MTIRMGNNECSLSYFEHFVIALAVYSRSSAAYEVLRSFNILKLPSRSTMQAYTSCFLHEGGSSWDCISKQVSRYEKFKQECREAGKLIPMGDGVLIFDEVKVISRVLWNSRSQTIVGLAMTAEDQVSLHDIYRQFSSNEKVKQTSYILQFLWRDMTSVFDIVGPYYSSCDVFSAKFIHACLLDTIQLFQVSDVHFCFTELYIVQYFATDSWVHYKCTCM